MKRYEAVLAEAEDMHKAGYDVDAIADILSRRRHIKHRDVVRLLRGRFSEPVIFNSAEALAAKRKRHEEAAAKARQIPFLAGR